MTNPASKVTNTSGINPVAKISSGGCVARAFDTSLAAFPTLFGDCVAWFDPTDISTMYIDKTQTANVTADGVNNVAEWQDKSGSAVPCHVQANSAGPESHPIFTPNHRNQNPMLNIRGDGFPSRMERYGATATAEGSYATNGMTIVFVAEIGDNPAPAATLLSTARGLAGASGFNVILEANSKFYMGGGDAIISNASVRATPLLLAGEAVVCIMRISETLTLEAGTTTTNINVTGAFTPDMLGRMVMNIPVGSNDYGTITAYIDADNVTVTEIVGMESGQSINISSIEVSDGDVSLEAKRSIISTNAPQAPSVHDYAFALFSQHNQSFNEYSGYVGDIIMYDKVLTQIEGDTLMSWLRLKWDI